MTFHRSWLPPGAVSRGLRELPLRATVRGWAAKWFAQPGADVAGDAEAVAARDLDAGASWALDEGVVVSASDDTPLAVAALMFGELPDAGLLSSADRSVLEAAADTCLADLRRRVAELVGIDAPWRPGSADAATDTWWQFRIAAGGPPLVRIAFGEAVVARCLRASLSPAAPRAKPRALVTALKDQPITLSARVGAARLTTSDLAALGIGDLLVLDRALADPVSIAVNHRPKSLACTIEQQDERLRLVLV